MPSSYNRIHKNHAAFCTSYKSKSLLYTPSYQATTYEDNYEDNYELCIQTGRVKFSERYSTGISVKTGNFSERKKKPLSCKGFNDLSFIEFKQQRKQCRKTYVLGELYYRIYCIYKVLEFSGIFVGLKLTALGISFCFRFVLFYFALSRGTVLKKTFITFYACTYRRF